jgi:hypothetical protein
MPPPIEASHRKRNGPGVCASQPPLPPPHERDLFGYDIDKAVDAALQRLSVQLESAAIDVHMALRRSFRQSRVRLLGWKP